MKYNKQIKVKMPNNEDFCSLDNRAIIREAIRISNQVWRNSLTNKQKMLIKLKNFLANFYYFMILRPFYCLEWKWSNMIWKIKNVKF